MIIWVTWVCYSLDRIYPNTMVPTYGAGRITQIFLSFHLPAIGSPGGEAGGDETEKEQTALAEERYMVCSVWRYSQYQARNSSGVTPKSFATASTREEGYFLVLPCLTCTTKGFPSRVSPIHLLFRNLSVPARLKFSRNRSN